MLGREHPAAEIQANMLPGESLTHGIVMDLLLSGRRSVN
jgi:hypothetical protein